MQIGYGIGLKAKRRSNKKIEMRRSKHKVNSYDESELITWLSQTERVKYIQRSERHYRYNADFSRRIWQMF